MIKDDAEQKELDREFRVYSEQIWTRDMDVYRD